MRDFRQADAWVSVPNKLGVSRQRQQNGVRSFTYMFEQHIPASSHETPPRVELQQRATQPKKPTWSTGGIRKTRKSRLPLEAATAQPLCCRCMTDTTPA